MRISPFPIFVPYLEHESLDSYAQRLATANHNTVDLVERIARRNGWLTGSARAHPSRYALWSALGSQEILTMPNGAPRVQTHPLCLLCTELIPAYGFVPDVGLICAQHETFYAATLIGASPQQVAAEIRYRNELAPDGIHIRDRLLLQAQNIAAFQSGAIPPNPEKHPATCGLDPDLYPQTIATAIEISRTVPDSTPFKHFQKGRRRTNRHPLRSR